MTAKITYPARESCEYFSRGYCGFYSMECFHENGDMVVNTRCNKLVPRRRSEMMPWMGDICSDCNEVECNDCHAFTEYMERSSHRAY